MAEQPEAGTEELNRRLHAVLQKCFRRAGKGAVQRVEDALAISRGSFRQWRRRGRLEVQVLLAALRELGISPAWFWLEVLGSDFDPVQLAGQVVGSPKDPVVRAALERSRSSARRSSLPLSPERLRELDALRDEDPARAVREVKSALGKADPADLPRLLAIYGSALRARAEIDKALEALHHALRLAECAEDASLVADVLQRLGVAYAYSGDNALGLLYAKEAGYRHRLAGDLRGEGRSWVDQGVRYAHLGKVDLAVAAFQRALETLPSDEVRHRFTAHQCLADLYHRQGQFDEALQQVSEAEALGSGVGKGLLGSLFWSKATIANGLPAYPQAEGAYAEAVETFRDVSPIDAALAAVELVRAQVLQGKHEVACETTRAMVSLLQPLKKNRIASAALMRLLRNVLEGSSITERMLDRAAQEIQEERARHRRRARDGH